MKTIKLNSSKFKRRSSLSQKSKLSYEQLIKKHGLSKKIENCKTHIDNNLYLHIAR